MAFLPTEPFGAGSISVGLHTLDDDGAEARAARFVHQALGAERAGFDGVTVPEHHGAFPGYMPQPLLACNWMLAATARLWAGPSPLVLTLRNPVLVAEQLAWTAAAFPGRFGAALAPGYSPADFEMVGAGALAERRFEEFGRRLDALLDALRADGPIGGDIAVTRWAANPPPLLRGVNSVAAARTAAKLGLGIVFPGGEGPDRLAGLTAAFRDAGGVGPVVWIRNLWLGAPPPGAYASLERTYVGASAEGMRQRQGFADATLTGSTAEVTASLVAGVERIGVTGVNLRFHLPGITGDDVDEQLRLAGAEVLPALRGALGG